MVHLAPPRHCAGAEMMLCALLAPLADRGHAVDVILSRPTPETEPYELEGTAITVHPWRSQWDPQEWVPKADVVVTHLENVPRAVVLSRMHAKPVVILCHNTHPATRVWHVEDAALMVYNSEWMAAELGPHDNALVVRPPVVASQYRTPGKGSKVTLVNLYEPKGGDVFWELARRMPDVEFLGVKGAYGEQVDEGPLPNVTIVEHTPDMRAVYAQTRVLIMPSRYESWGRVGVEAMCSGIPVVANPTPGLLESLGDAGIFVDVEDLEGWERAVGNLLHSTPAHRAASAAAKARAAELEPTPDLGRWVDAIEALV